MANESENPTAARRAALRREARARRDGMPEEERRTASRRICGRFLALPEIVRAGSFLVYAAFRSEVATAELIAALQGMGKTVCLPLVVRETKDMLAIRMDAAFSLATGFQGIPEPEFRPDRLFPPEALDVVVLPDLLFDRAGNRLGYGGGFYDRFLANRAPQALRVGLAFAWQLADTDIPTEPHDMRLDLVVTERYILRFPG